MIGSEAVIYLDNAATTYPKPEAVPRAMEHSMRRAGGNPGRGGHALAMAAAEEVFACRRALGALLGAGAEQVVFTHNATEALNLAIKGLVRKNGRGSGHILMSDLEHNAVRRPVLGLRYQGYACGVFESGMARGTVDSETIRRSILRQLRPDTCLLVCTHASNLVNAHLPIEMIGEICRARGIRFVVDASQSAGILPIDLEKIGADAVCAPGHKGLYGPMGSGFAVFSSSYGGEGGGGRIRTLTEGGAGVDSVSSDMPGVLPERLEAGTLPVPAIAGLRAGIEAVTAMGIDRILAHGTALARRLRERAREIEGIRIWGGDACGGLVLLSKAGMTSEAVADHLSERGICVRAGLHCAPLAHRTLGTPEDGAVRVSFSVYNTEAQVDAVCHALSEL